MLEVKNLSFAYGKTAPKILDGIDFSIEQGHVTAILGNNGAGKSTLIKCMTRINTGFSGSITVDGADITAMGRTELARNVAYVPQSGQTSRTLVFDAVLLGRKPYIKWGTVEQDREIVEDILKRLEIQNLSARYLDELSGGEMQKVTLARALAQQPQYLLLDEPTSNLDPRNQHEMLRIVRDIAKEKNIGIAIIIHDLNLALRYCDRFLFLKDSQVYSHGGQEVYTPQTIQQVYGIHVHIIEHRNIRVVVPFPDELMPGAHEEAHQHGAP